MTCLDMDGMNPGKMLNTGKNGSVNVMKHGNSMRKENGKGEGMMNPFEIPVGDEQERMSRTDVLKGSFVDAVTHIKIWQREFSVLLNEFEDESGVDSEEWYVLNELLKDLECARHGFNTLYDLL